MDIEKHCHFFVQALRVVSACNLSALVLALMAVWTTIGVAADSSATKSGARQSAGSDRTSAVLAVQPVDLSALGNAAQPNVTVLAHDQFLLSWQSRLEDGCHALRLATLSATGDLGPIREAARGCNWFVNWADFPSAVVADNGDWLTFWLEKSSPESYAYNIRISRSRDRGKSFSAPIAPHDDGTLSEHGFVSMAPAGEDRVLVVWLDGRHSVPSQAREQHTEHHEHESRMSLRSAVLGRDDQLRHALEIDGDVCSCCQTDLVRTRRNEHRVVFRDRSKENVRDIGSHRFDGRQWHAEGHLNKDQWTIAGCPVNGPALAFDGNHSLAVWATMGQSSNGTATNDAPQTLAVRARLLGEPMLELEREAGTLGRVDAAAMKGGWLVSWLGQGARANASALFVARFDSKLEERGRVMLAELPGGRDLGVPRLAASKYTAVMVWTEASPDRARRLQARLLSAHE